MPLLDFDYAYFDLGRIQDMAIAPRQNLDSEFDTPQASPGFLLWYTTNRWQASQRAALRPFGLTHVQFVALASLVWLKNKRVINQRDLASFASIDPMMTSQVLRSLEAKNLIVRSQDPLDKRAWLLSATEAGTELANQAIVAVERCDEEFFSRLIDVEAFVEQLKALSAIEEA
ncbi:unnamed protein product [Acidithrix sp. C25]|nr:unnamed protein product [Acidithrix sp. C25]